MSATVKPLLPAFTGAVNTVHCADALEFMHWLWRQGVQVDAIITDLPYGTTACSWDEIIPFAPMWAAVKRILKPRGVFVTTATEPFASLLIVSNLEMFRYKWAWNKGQGSDFQLAKLRPLSAIEDVCVFSEGKTANGAASNMVYYPQMESRDTPTKSGGAPSAKYLNKHNMQALGNVYHERYPINYLEFSKDVGKNRVHPTQKPVALYEYLVRTYTQPGELVLDFCCGSGTTGVACVKTGRKYIGCDTSPEYVKIAHDRIHAGFVTVELADGVKQPSLFAQLVG